LEFLSTLVILWHNNGMIKVVLFDFDGTLAVSMEMVYDIYGEVAEKYNLVKIDGSQVEALKKYSAREFIKLLKIKPADFPKIHREVMDEFSKRMEKIKLPAGVEAVLKKIKEKGMTMGIVTSNKVSNVNRFLKAKGVLNYFDIVDDEKNLWGKGAKIKKLIKEKGWKSEEVIYVGDESRDVEAAKVAKIKVIGVSWGYEAKENLVKAGAEWVIDKPEEILRILLR
jgi:phosphoglycolate phosphatase